MSLYLVYQYVSVQNYPVRVTQRFYKSQYTCSTNLNTPSDKREHQADDAHIVASICFWDISPRSRASRRAFPQRYMSQKHIDATIYCFLDLEFWSLEKEAQICHQNLI